MAADKGEQQMQNLAFTQAGGALDEKRKLDESREAMAGQARPPPVKAGKTKSPMVQLAMAEDRSRALRVGFLEKLNGKNMWQRRWFEIVGHYFVYYKRHDSTDLLAAMDLWKAQPPRHAPTESVFYIEYDRDRAFRAKSAADAAKWIRLMLQVQRSNPNYADSPAAKGEQAGGGGSAAAAAGGGEPGGKGGQAKDPEYAPPPMKDDGDCCCVVS